MKQKLEWVEGKIQGVSNTPERNEKYQRYYKRNVLKTQLKEGWVEARYDISLTKW